MPMKERACGKILTIRREPLSISVYEMKFSRKVKVYQKEHYDSERKLHGSISQGISKENLKAP